MTGNWSYLLHCVPLCVLRVVAVSLTLFDELAKNPSCCPPANLHGAPKRWPVADLEAVLLQADDHSPRAACCAGDLTCAQQFRLRPTVNTYGTKPDFTPVAIYRVFSLPWSQHVFTKHQREITCKGANIT